MPYGDNVMAPPMAPVAGAQATQGGGLSDWWRGNQTTVTAPNGTVTQTGSPGLLQQGGAIQMGIGALSTLGSLWNTFQQSKLARESFKFEKQAYKTNLKNQTQTYNTELEDRIRTRYAAEGRPEQADAYVAKNKL
jgi:hypothetical protein